MTLTGVNGTYSFAAANNETAKRSALQKDEPVSIMEFDAGKSNNTINVDYACTDGNDDAKLSFGEGVKAFFKGMGKQTINMITSPFTELAKGNPVPALIAGAGIAAVSLIGAPAVVALGAIGVVAGGAQALGGIGKAMNAESDAEAKAALEQTGGGAYTTGMSVIAVKGGLNKMAKVEGSHMEAAYRDGTSKTKAYFQDVKDMAGNKFGSITSRFGKGGDDTGVGGPDDPAGGPGGPNDPTGGSGGSGNSLSLQPDTILDQDGNPIAYFDEATGTWQEFNPGTTTTGARALQAGGGQPVQQNGLPGATADSAATGANSGQNSTPIALGDGSGELVPASQAQTGTAGAAVQSQAPEVIQLGDGSNTSGLTQGNVLKLGGSTPMAEATYAQKLAKIGALLGMSDDEVRQVPAMIQWFDANGGDHTQTLLTDIIAAYKAANGNNGFGGLVPVTQAQTGAQAVSIGATTAASQAQILEAFQALADAQEAVNMSWSRKPSYFDTQAWTRWETQHNALQNNLDTADSALQALFQ